MATLLEPVSNRKALCGAQHGTSVHPGPTLCPASLVGQRFRRHSWCPSAPSHPGRVLRNFPSHTCLPSAVPCLPLPHLRAGPLPPTAAVHPPTGHPPPRGPSHGKANSVHPGSTRGPAESLAKSTFLVVWPSMACPLRVCSAALGRHRPALASSLRLQAPGSAHLASCQRVSHPKCWRGLSNPGCAWDRSPGQVPASALSSISCLCLEGSFR